MKFYDCTPAPSPRRVRIFIAEKGLDIETIQVDLRNKEQMNPDFAKKNPWLTVPVLELDDGTCISEIGACCRYLEEVHPEPPLLGRDAKDKAIVEMWNHHMEVDGIQAGSEAFRNSTKAMVGRALTGPYDYEQIPALAERGKKRLANFFETLDKRLAESRYIAGDSYSIADITAKVTVDFAGWVKVAPLDSQTNLRRWYDEVSARPSAKV